MTRARELADLLTGGQTISTADNTEQIILVSTDTDSTSGPELKMYRNSASPADNDFTGIITFHGENDADEEIEYSRIRTRIVDATDGSEDSRIEFEGLKDGSSIAFCKMDSSNTVFNEDSQDIDFRVESNGNANMLFVDGSNNRVGIGEASPAAPLHISTGASTAAELRITSNNTGSGSGDRGRIAVYSSRNDGTAYEAGRIEIDRSSGTEDKAHFIFSTNNGSGVEERVRITSSGQVLVGDGTPNAAGSLLELQTAQNTANVLYMLKTNQVEMTMGFKSSTDSNFYIGTGSSTIGTYGVYLTNQANSFTSISDERKKTIIEPIENASQKVSSLRTVIGRFNHDEDDKRRSFLIAQDVQAVLPEAVSVQQDEDGTLGLSYTDVIPLLTAALKESITKIETLETEMTALKARVTTLEGE